MSKQRIKRVKDYDAGTVDFIDIASGDHELVNYHDFPEVIQNRFGIHGVNAKVGDTAADPNVDAMTVIRAVVAQLKLGDWSTRAGAAGPRVTRLGEALYRLARAGDLPDVDQDQTDDELMAGIVDRLDELSDEEKKELRGHPKIKSVLAEITAERAAEKVKSTKAGAKDADVITF